MKKTFFASIVAMASLISFTSCDEDVATGMNLSGDWYGDFGMYYEDSYGRYWDSYDTNLSFIPYQGNATRGHGYETDYYKVGPYSEIYHAFEWEVRNGIIYIEYCGWEDADLDTFIRDYSMTNDYFSGYFGNSSSRFSLRKYADYYNWNTYIVDYGYGDYNHGYGYGYRPSSYLAGTRAEGDSVGAEKPAVVRIGNRFSGDRK